MTACHAETRRSAPLLLALALSLAAVPAVRADEPISLLPGPANSSSGASAPAAVQGPSAAFPEVTPSSTQIRVQDLGAVDVNSTGVIDDAHGGLGTAMWTGASMSLVEKVIPVLPASAPSPAMHDLMRRLLLTTAVVPPGKTSAPQSLVALRAAKLIEMGEVEGALQLLKDISPSSLTADLRRGVVDTALLSGDDATACGQIADLRTAMGNDPFPAKLQVYCQIAAGKVGEAGLGIDVLREQRVADPIFFAAADFASGIGAGKVGDAWGQPSALDLAMARAAKLPLADVQAQQIRVPAFYKAASALPGASADARLVLAEKAAQAGILGIDELRRLYEAQNFTPQELDQPSGANSVKSRALMYRAVLNQVLPGAKAELIRRALTAPGPAYLLAARVFAPEIAGLAPDPQLASFAPVAARALLAAGRPEAAAWIQLARTQAANTAALPGLALLQRLAQPNVELPAATVSAWAETKSPSGPQQRRLAVGFGLLSALGVPVPAEAWLPLLDGPSRSERTVASPGLWHGLRLAGDSVGETVLMALASLGEGGLGEVDPVDLYRSIVALRHVGLDADARALAVEAALANGV